MANVSKVGVSTVNGGVVTGPGAPTVLVEGVPISTVGDAITTHAPGVPPHTAAVMVGCSTTVMANNKFICRNGDLASCAHPVVSASATVTNNL